MPWIVPSSAETAVQGIEGDIRLQPAEDFGNVAGGVDAGDAKAFIFERPPAGRARAQTDLAFRATNRPSGRRRAGS